MTGFSEIKAFKRYQRKKVFLKRLHVDHDKSHPLQTTPKVSVKQNISLRFLNAKYRPSELANNEFKTFQISFSC